MPNLENLKKQAKLYVRWHRGCHYPVAARIREVLPGFRHLSDREILAHSFKLSDAQELVARKAGFDSWEALRRGVQTMTDTQFESLSKPTLLGAELNYLLLISPSRTSFIRRLSASITLNDAKTLFLECQAAGVTFHQTLQTEPWGARTFIVRDPDGNLILFSSRSE